MINSTTIKLVGASQVSLSATREHPRVLVWYSYCSTRVMQFFSSIAFTACTLINITGAFSSCELKCCEGNLCDPYGGGATTSAVSVLAASFGAILVALNMLAWFNWSVFWYQGLCVNHLKFIYVCVCCKFLEIQVEKVDLYSSKTSLGKKRGRSGS